MVPVGIKRLGMTNSMHGITYKDLISMFSGISDCTKGSDL